METRSIAWLILGGALVLAPAASGQEKRVQRADLPLAVQHAVDANSAGATIRGFSRERENGHTYYEAEMTVNGLGRDVLMDSTGAIVELEQVVPLDSLPAAVRSALVARARHGRITKVESLTKHGTLVAYEAQVKTGAKHSEIQVGPAGEKLKHEE